MTWLYVPSVSATATEDSSLDCESTGYEPWLVLSGTATQRPFSWHGWKNRAWIRRLCGTILRPSTAQRGVDAWISSLRDSRASLSPLPVNVRELTMTGGSGLPSDGSSVTWDREACSWRTSPDLFSTGYLTSSPILPTSGSMRSGVCTPRPTLVPLIDGNESGFWHSPMARDCKGEGFEDTNLPSQVKMWPTPNTMTGGQTSRSGDRKGELLLGGAARMWGTPVARDDQKSPEAHLEMKARMGGGRTEPTSLTVQVKMWPTPRASEMHRGSDPDRGPAGGSKGLKHEAEAFHLDPTTSPDGNDGSPRADLNPRFVAALMGVPWDWLMHSISEATDSFPRVQPKRSASYSGGSDEEH